MLCYHTFSPEKLREPPQTDFFVLNEHPSLQVDFLAFQSEKPSKQPPVVILSGAFQSFASFQTEVQALVQTHAVIIVEMPSQGNNMQIVDDFSLYDYAALLYAFVRQHQLAKINLIGLSYGSAMALIYAGLYPNYCHKLILSGITCFKREDMLPLLNDSFELLQADNMEGYATLALSHLINHNRLAQTGIQKIHRRLLYRQVKTLQDVQRKRHISNTQRLIDFTGFKQFPVCPTLVVAGEFDNFTQADEQATTAQHCANAAFVIIKNADHLIQLEQVEAMAQLGQAFFNNQDLSNIDNLCIYQPDGYVFDKSHIAPLVENLNLKATLIAQDKSRLNVRIEALNVSEFILSTDTDINKVYSKLYIPCLNLYFYVHLLSIKNSNSGQINGIFSQQVLKDMHALQEFVASFSLPV